MASKLPALFGALLPLMACDSTALNAPRFRRTVAAAMTASASPTKGAAGGASVATSSNNQAKYQPTTSQADIAVEEFSGTTLSSSQVIDQFSLAHFSPKSANGFPAAYYSLSDSGLFTQRTWSPYVYGDQGSLIAKKLLAFGTSADLLYVRGALLAAPVDTSGEYGGMVDDSTQERGHLGVTYSAESTLEYVIMARDYVAHSGDTAVFSAPISRVLCYTNKAGASISLNRKAGPTFDCGGDPGQGNAIAFVERTHAGFSTNLVNPAESLGQSFSVDEDFTSLQLGMQDPGMGSTASIRVVLYDSTRNRIALDKQLDNPGLTNGWLVLDQRYLGSTQPVGTYQIAIYPVASSYDPAQPQTGMNLNPQDSYYYSLGWWTEASTVTNGGAVSKLYPQDTDPLAAPWKAWTLSQKVEFAMNWALSQATQATGRLGAFDSESALGSICAGTAEASTQACTYYDLFRSGGKDSYTNMIFLKAMSDYLDLSGAGLVRQQFSAQDLSVAAQQITQEFSAHTGGNGALMSWIDAQGSDHWLALLTPHALAVSLGSLLPEASELQNVFDVIRGQSRLSDGYFRTNAVPVEDIGPWNWAASSAWSSPVSNNGVPGFANEDSTPGGYWQIFPANGHGAYGDGAGNFGNQENNGGVLLGTTSFVFSAGPYPEMYQDYKGLVSSLEAIANAITAGTYDGYKLPNVRKPVTASNIFDYCAQAHAGPAPAYGYAQDSQNASFCGFYKSISYDLPEAGAFPAYFVEGLLGLKLGLDGTVSSFSRLLSSTPTVITLPSQRFPTVIKSVRVTGLNVFGHVRAITCSVAIPTMSCILD